ncbi:hypothetical protein GUITHDRAFT_110360 [Guillardia theta CCMP2712]|uniref:Uncharacterized protein n=1 Tax=Guillardia theta (strain CCMP2712) TaxID=905079 RepID=L1J611_GUITC|nr:hypothetical protein GUITHDRAFT_110360 [Guillardia theta CCMP2712]EKX43554.1 hypothetical protein GUITHDRAFT_110360 [Guillardia theta CCMP2712]|eukprot:XP_005830534.1 hypothetical protein GUITHDRAFT_110360 [Guillardia theta CCMP2712]
MGGKANGLGTEVDLCAAERKVNWIERTEQVQLNPPMLVSLRGGGEGGGKQKAKLREDRSKRQGKAETSKMKEHARNALRKGSGPRAPNRSIGRGAKGRRVEADESDSSEEQDEDDEGDTSRSGQEEEDEDEDDEEDEEQEELSNKAKKKREKTSDGRDGGGRSSGEGMANNLKDMLNVEEVEPDSQLNLDMIDSAEIREFMGKTMMQAEDSMEAGKRVPEPSDSSEESESRKKEMKKKEKEEEEEEEEDTDD